MNNLKYLREQANLSQEKLGELINVSQQSIFKYEKGEVQASQAVLKKLSKVFSVPVDVLIDDDINIEDYIKDGGTELSEDEKELVKAYRKLNDNEKMQLSMMLKEMLSNIK